MSDIEALTQGMTSASPLPRLRATDAIPPHDPHYVYPVDSTHGKSQAKSLMHPTDLARRLLPRDMFLQLQEFCYKGCWTDCGIDWPPDVIAKAAAAGPHISALDPDSVTLIWEDISYQVAAGFVKLIQAEDLFGPDQPHNLKISRVALIPQANRRGRIILNLSAAVNLDPEPVPGQKRSRHSTPTSVHPSVNETTVPAPDQSGVDALGSSLPSILKYMFETDCEWEIDWQKIDLSDGFWRMIVASGEEFNFVFQMPQRPDDSSIFYVVPSSLQMGWKNSPAYFCVATLTARELVKRILAMTLHTGIDEPHKFENYCIPKGLAPVTSDKWTVPENLTIFSTVFVDDFCNGMARPRNLARNLAQITWVTRAFLHGIHAVFPPPEVLQHEGGKDSISEKKLKKEDALWELQAILLGILADGGFGPNRTVSLPLDKYTKYRGGITDALAVPRATISFKEFQKVHGQIQYVATVIPCIRGLMTPLNRRLAIEDIPVGLGKGTAIRRALTRVRDLMDLAQTRPSHICEIVAPSLPGVYGPMDAAAIGAGGVLLPCTEYIQPTVWRVQWPPDITAAIRAGTISMADGESISYFIQECLIDHLLKGNVAGLSSFIWSDNTPTVGRITKRSSGGESRVAENMLYFLAMRQLFTKRGPSDCNHWPGSENLMADVPSRSFEEGFPADQDDAFLKYFAHRFPLPACFPRGSPDQPTCWRLVTPPKEVISAAISLLRGTPDTSPDPTVTLGDSGVPIPRLVIKTLYSSSLPAPITKWNESTCSWPLLVPSGKVSSIVDPHLRARASRQRYEKSPNSWTIEDLETLGARLHPKST